VPDIEADFQRELAEIEAESMGWIPFDEGVYLHVSDENAAEWVFWISTTTKHGGVGLKQKPNDQALWRASQH
jgi:hypothetical protein